MQLARQQSTRAIQKSGQAAVPQLACSMMISPAWQGRRCIRSQTCCLSGPSRWANTGMPLQHSDPHLRLPSEIGHDTDDSKTSIWLHYRRSSTVQPAFNLWVAMREASQAG